MTLKRLTWLFGILSLVIALSTWVMDLTHLVIECIYCRSERTIIGLLGVLILLPIFPHITRYFACVAGFFGASVASQQVILILKSGEMFPFELWLATGALFILVGQVLFICYLEDRGMGNNGTTNRLKDYQSRLRCK